MMAKSRICCGAGDPAYARCCCCCCGCRNVSSRRLLSTRSGAGPQHTPASGRLLQHGAVATLAACFRCASLSNPLRACMPRETPWISYEVINMFALVLDCHHVHFELQRAKFNGCGLGAFEPATPHGSSESHNVLMAQSRRDGDATPSDYEQARQQQCAPHAS